MANDYFDASQVQVGSGRARSSHLNDISDAVETAFDSVETEMDTNTAHVYSDGSNHSDVVSNTADILAHTISTGSSHSDVVANTAHRHSDGIGHSLVDSNRSHSLGDGSDHADVANNTSARHDEFHTVASHSDTSATGTQLNELVQTISPTNLHKHNMLSAPTDTGVVYVNDAATQVEIGSNYNLAVTETGIFGNIDCYGNIVVSGTIAGRDVASDGTEIDLNTASRHDESHTIASHSDTTATGSDIESLTDGSPDSDVLHRHRELRDNYDNLIVTVSGGVLTVYHAGNPLLQTTSGGEFFVNNLTILGGDVNFLNLPTTDPSINGKAWNDSGTLKISAG